ncbi:uncharacterized protein [Anabrus simplex]|uniref:uncharacterized protein n=1 Tax=Anabrus simplex TaxID=316456 RepID=UPI0034DD7E27
MRAATVLFVGLVAAVLLVQCLAVCPQCSCPASYEPVCSYNKVTGRYRGYSSRCVLDCTNKCRKGENDKFEFRFNGRCGKKRIASRPRSNE